MPVFVTSVQATSRHGVFAVERLPPAQITPTGTGVACIVDQFPWGPAPGATPGTNGFLYTPSGIKDWANNFAPPGFLRTYAGAGGAGYLATIRKAWPNNQLKTIRVLGGTAVTATALVQTGGAVTIWTVGAKFPGANGSLMTCTTAAASDGIAGHVKLTITITGVTGTTSDIIDNLPTAAAPATPPDLSKLLLVGSLTFGTGGTAVQSTVNFTSGTDGTVNAATYTGTAGNGDFGIARAETDASIRHIFTGDPGNTIRSAVNAALLAHVNLQSDRVAYINGNSGQSAAAVLTDAATYSASSRVLYVDPYVYILDDTTATKTLVPGAPFAASVAAQLPPSTAISWKNAEVQAMLAGINDLEIDRGNNAGNNTLGGICTVIRETTGGFTFEADSLTITPVDNTKRRLARTRTGDFIASSVTASLRGFVDAPNVPDNQQSVIQAVDAFMASMKKAASQDPNHRAHVLDYQIGNLSAANAQTDLDQGNFFIPLDVKTSSGMEKIFLSIRFGENVTVSHVS
jgi:phage tail sheath protein FI